MNTLQIQIVTLAYFHTFTFKLFFATAETLRGPMKLNTGEYSNAKRSGNSYKFYSNRKKDSLRPGHSEILKDPHYYANEHNDLVGAYYAPRDGSEYLFPGYSTGWSLEFRPNPVILDPNDIVNTSAVKFLAFLGILAMIQDLFHKSLKKSLKSRSTTPIPINTHRPATNEPQQPIPSSGTTPPYKPEPSPEQGSGSSPNPGLGQQPEPGSTTGPELGQKPEPGSTLVPELGQKPASESTPVPELGQKPVSESTPVPESGNPESGSTLGPEIEQKPTSESTPGSGQQEPNFGSTPHQESGTSTESGQGPKPEQDPGERPTQGPSGNRPFNPNSTPSSMGPFRPRTSFRPRVVTGASHVNPLSVVNELTTKRNLSLFDYWESWLL